MARAAARSIPGSIRPTEPSALTWHRVVLVSDLTASPRKFAKYYNGFKHREDLSGDGNAIDSRFALPSEIFMFNDGDDNEQSTAYISSLQFRDVALTDEEVAALGGPSASGIPTHGCRQRLWRKLLRLRLSQSWL